MSTYCRLLILATILAGTGWKEDDSWKAAEAAGKTEQIGAAVASEEANGWAEWDREAADPLEMSLTLAIDAGAGGCTPEISKKQLNRMQKRMSCSWKDMMDKYEIYM